MSNTQIKTELYAAPATTTDTPATGVPGFSPQIVKTCEGVSWSHPAINHPSNGVPVGYEYSLNNGAKVPYTPGEVIFQEWNADGSAPFVSLFPTYKSGFTHQMGQSKFFNDVFCVPQPPAEVREVVTEGEPDCDAMHVEITTGFESAGYWLNGEEWVLGDWFPTADEPVITGREATVEECPVVIPDPVNPESPAAPAESPAEGTELPAPLKASTAQPVAPLEVQAAAPGLAETGGEDPLGALLIGAASLAAGGSLLARRTLARWWLSR